MKEMNAPKTQDAETHIQESHLPQSQMQKHNVPKVSKKDRNPVIALTSYHNTETDESYMRPACLKAVTAAGGIPVILPLLISHIELSQLVSMFDAFLFCGGPDVHPFYFGEDAHARSGNISIKRDELELSLLRLAMNARKPILGICRGIQLINIGLGGNIYQDIPSQFSSSFPLAHAQPFGYEIPSHTVTVVPETTLAHIYKSSFPTSDPSSSSQTISMQVNSMHHQAIRRLAPGLTASAFASDGLIEAVEYPEYPSFFLGVQWHPEYLWPNQPEAAGLFHSFVAAAHDMKETDTKKTDQTHI